MTGLRARGSRAAAIAFALLLADCKVFETEAPPPRYQAPQAFDEAPATVASLPARALPAQDLTRWWAVWRDPILDRQIREALAANTDIRIAQAHVKEARALAAVVASALDPQVGVQAEQWGAAVHWRNPVFNVTPGGTNRTLDAHLAGVVATWEPDIFEGRADDAEAARAWALSVDEQSSGVRKIVAAEVAQNYQEARGLQRRRAILDASLAALRQLLVYVEGRFAAGQALASDVVRIRERLEQQRANRPVLAAQLDLRERRLAVLKGCLPERIERLPPPGGFTAPAVPTGQMPSDVLEHRPDVRAAALLVRSQAARLSSAKSDLLPRFRINFFGGDGRLHIEGLPGLQGTGGLASIDVNMPIFTGGRIEANIAANDARLQQAAAGYDEVMLRALEDVEEAYNRRRNDDRNAAEIARALASAKRHEEASAGLYEGGRKTLDEVLNARLDALARADDLAQAQMALADATVQLYLALGGGW